MNGNKIGYSRLFITALLLAGLAAPAAYADPIEGTGPAMYGVREIIINKAKFGDSGTAKNCGLSLDEVSEALRKKLQQSGVPALDVKEAPPANMGVARLFLTLEIYTYNSPALDCVSWVSLRAEGKGRVRIPPVELIRNITIDYWHQGILISGSQAAHDGQVNSGISRLAGMFADEYKLEQPPSPYH
jgi:hypothetical protein